MIRILIADDHAILREGLAALVARADAMEVVCQAGDGDEALALIEGGAAVDVAVLDVAMPGPSGIDIAERLQARGSGPRVVLLTMHGEASLVRRARDAGVAGFVLKESAFAELTDAIARAAAGETFFSPGLLAAERRRGEGPPALTRREREVLSLVAEGLTSRRIARQLGVSVKTVETHRANIMAKLDAPNAAALVRYAVAHQLVRGSGG